MLPNPVLLLPMSACAPWRVKSEQFCCTHLETPLCPVFLTMTLMLFSFANASVC